MWLELRVGWELEAEWEEGLDREWEEEVELDSERESEEVMV